jgi:hypothetical protein
VGLRDGVETGTLSLVTPRANAARYFSSYRYFGHPPGTAVMHARR